MNGELEVGRAVVELIAKTLLGPVPEVELSKKVKSEANITRGVVILGKDFIRALEKLSDVSSRVPEECLKSIAVTLLGGALLYPLEKIKKALEVVESSKECFEVAEKFCTGIVGLGLTAGRYAVAVVLNKTAPQLRTQLLPPKGELAKKLLTWVKDIDKDMYRTLAGALEDLSQFEKEIGETLTYVVFGSALIEKPLDMVRALSEKKYGRVAEILKESYNPSNFVDYAKDLIRIHIGTPLETTIHTVASLLETLYDELSYIAEEEGEKKAREKAREIFREDMYEELWNLYHAVKNAKWSIIHKYKPIDLRLLDEDLGRLANILYDLKEFVKSAKRKK